MDFTPELQRQRVLVRWRKQADKELNLRVTNERRPLLLARLIGYLQGDGCIGEHISAGKTHHDIMFYPDALEIAELFAKTFQLLFGRSPKIKALENHYCVRICHKSAYAELAAIAAYKSMEWRAPRSLLASAIEAREWLRAIFDCEAYVGKQAIVVNSVNEAGLQDVQAILHESGIQSRMYVYKRKQPNWNTNYILSIGRRTDRQSFLKLVGFNHPRKQEKLQKILATVAQPGRAAEPSVVAESRTGLSKPRPQGPPGSNPGGGVFEN